MGSVYKFRYTDLMLRLNRSLAVAALLLPWVGGVLPAQRAVEFEVRYWMPTVQSRLRLGDQGLASEIDFKKDLGVPDPKLPEGRFTYFGKGNHRLRLAYSPIEFNGDSLVTRTVVFGGKQYAVGTRVLSDLEIQHLKLGWAWQFINVHNGVFKLGTLLEANGFLMKGRLRTSNLVPAVDEREDLSVGLPTAGLAMDINPHSKLNLFAEVSGLKIGRYGYFVNTDAGVKVYPVSNVFLTGGYRNFNLHAKVDPDFARVVLRGLFVGGGVHF
jgi:hypothetical protein